MKKPETQPYEAPLIEVIAVQVESGFGTSLSDNAFDDDNPIIDPPFGA